MHACFNLNWGEHQQFQLKFLDQLISQYKLKFDVRFYDKNKILCQKQLEEYISKKNASNIELDGDKLQTDFFPQINSHIFLSHSHKDEQVALRIKFILEKCFGLSVFVDSYVWDYCNKLLQIIDNQYCRNEGTVYYNYAKRNNSTAAVHLMLSTALMQMMDRTEVIFFLNTASSNLEDAYGEEVQTASPWIYHELSLMKCLRDNPPKRMMRKFASDGAITEEMYITHRVDIKSFPTLSPKDFSVWINECKPDDAPEDVIEKLYNYYVRNF